MEAIHWEQLGVGVAAIVGMIYIVRSMRGIFTEMLRFMYNHHSDITRALSAVADRLEHQEDAFDRLTDELQKK